MKQNIFGDLDLRSISGKSKLLCLYRIGYFQSDYEMSDFRKSIFEHTFLKDIAGDPCQIFDVVHVRGGDYLSARGEKVKFGLLNAEEYGLLLDSLAEKRPLYLMTNDVQYARSVILRKFEIVSGDLRDDISCAAAAEIFIASRSTLSLWIVMYRSSLGRLSLVPDPFWINAEVDWPDSVNIVPVQIA